MAEYQIVKYKHGKITFEVLTYMGSVLKYRDGKIGNIENVLMSDEIFTDHKKGYRAKASELSDAFGTENPQECCKIIVEKGDLELSIQERREAVEKKRLEIVNYIHRYYVDPKTNKPHPTVRIENALADSKAKYDPDRDTVAQANALVDKMLSILPLKRSDMQGVVKVTHQYVGAVSGILKKYCTDINESYDSEGCTYNIGFLPGDYDSISSNLHKVTQGNFKFEVEGLSEGKPEEETPKGKGKKAAKKTGKKK